MSPRSLVLAMALMAAAPVQAGQVDTTPSSSHGDSAPGSVSDALGHSWLSGDPSKHQLKSSRDIVIDARRRTLMVFAIPAKHRKVVAMLQRILADPTDKSATPASLAPKIPPKPTGPMSTYKYHGEKLSTIIRDLAAEANMNLVVRGPEPAQTCDVTFKNVQTKDLLKLLLDVYNFNYQMSPNGETLVVFTGPTHRVMESYTIPPKVEVPLEEIAQALQVAILDVDEPVGVAEDAPTYTGDVSVEVPAASPVGTGDGTTATGGATGDEAVPVAPPSPEISPNPATGGAIEVSPHPVDLPSAAPSPAPVGK